MSLWTRKKNSAHMTTLKKGSLSNSGRIQLHTLTFFPATAYLRLPEKLFTEHSFPWHTNPAHPQGPKKWRKQKIANLLFTTRPYTIKPKIVCNILWIHYATYIPKFTNNFRNWTKLHTNPLQRNGYCNFQNPITCNLTLTVCKFDKHCCQF